MSDAPVEPPALLREASTPAGGAKGGDFAWPPEHATVVADHARAFEAVAERLTRSGRDVERVLTHMAELRLALPTWGTGAGGTRFARFAWPGEPTTVFERLEDCAVVGALVRTADRVSLHFPWDDAADLGELREFATSRGLSFDAVNSNTFEDRPSEPRSYRYGSLSHTDAAVRAQAIAHNLECIERGKQLGSKALTLWLPDGSNFPGQQDHRGALERVLSGMREIYAALPSDWQLFLEHKLYEPALYATVISDWGTSLLCAESLGPKAACLVDLGHHAPTTNIEQIVARLVARGRLGGFHFNDSKYGDDDLDSGSLDPFRLFLVFHELVSAHEDGALARTPAYMLDQSHNLTDPIESLICSSVAVARAHAQALLVDRAALSAYQSANDVVMAHQTLQQATRFDVEPLLAEVRRRRGGALDPLAAYRASGYRKRQSEVRARRGSAGGGIV